MNCGNRYDISFGCCEPILAPIENYYTRWEVDKLIDDISGITSGDVETLIDEATSGMATQEWTINQGYLTSQALEGYVTENDLTGYTYDKQTIDEKIASGGTFDPANYYNKTETNALLDDKLDASAYTPTDLSNYDTKSEVDDKISSAVTEVNNALTAHTSNNEVHVTTAQTAAWDAKSNFSGSYNDLTDKPTIPTIWSGTEQQWSQISGGTLDNNTIYLVY